jgi:alpha-ketoglutarate-dependent taurine dioxygenase
MVVAFIKQTIGEKIKILETFDFVNTEHVFDNIIFYKNTFLDNGVMAFRNANLSHEEHITVHNILGKQLGSHKETGKEGYTENHSRLYGGTKIRPSNDEILLPWHIEHPHYQNPIVLGTWNMHKFTTNSENGKTYFVDNEFLYEQMPDSFKEFSKKCTILNPVGKEVFKEHELIQNHWITENPVIRIGHLFNISDLKVETAKLNNFQKLYKFEGRDPIENEYEYYFEIMKWIRDQLYNNLDIRIVHKWQQGDLVVSDMYRMCHAVTGGFESKDREFTGIWGRKNKQENGDV